MDYWYVRDRRGHVVLVVLDRDGDVGRISATGLNYLGLIGCPICTSRAKARTEGMHECHCSYGMMRITNPGSERSPAGCPT